MFVTLVCTKWNLIIRDKSNIRIKVSKLNMNSKCSNISKKNSTADTPVKALEESARPTWFHPQLDKVSQGWISSLPGHNGFSPAEFSNTIAKFLCLPHLVARQDKVYSSTSMASVLILLGIIVSLYPTFLGTTTGYTMTECKVIIWIILWHHPYWGYGWGAAAGGKGATRPLARLQDGNTFTRHDIKLAELKVIWVMVPKK